MFAEANLPPSANARFIVDAYKGMPRLRVIWTTPTGERTTRGSVRNHELAGDLIVECGHMDMGRHMLHIATQYEKHAHDKFMADVHAIRTHLYSRWPSVPISSDELDALMKDVISTPRRYR